MISILFVDDDSNILRGLRDSLRRNRRVWNMVFAVSGQEALERMKSQAFDIVVSDMRMAVMDGADLLNEIRIHYPEVTRLVLSGHSEREQLLRASTVAHQYLSKPCDGIALREVIERIARARARVANSKTREMVGRLDGLPTVGAMNQELMQYAVGCAEPRDALGILLSRDADLSLRISQLASRAFPEELNFADSGGELLEKLGFEAVRALAIASLVAADLERAEVAIEPNDWLTHVARCARFSRDLTTREHLKEIAFASGMLHDLGKVVHWLNVPGVFDQLYADPELNGRLLCEREADVLGTDHSQTGGLLLDSWGVNPVVALACAMHHGESLDAGIESDDELLAAVIGESVRHADELVHSLDSGKTPQQADCPADLVPLWQTWSIGHGVQEIV